MNDDRLDWHLENWVTYMKTASSKLGYPAASLVLESGGESTIDQFELMCEECDFRCAGIMDKIIDSLTAPQKTAVNHIWLQVKHHYPTQELDYDEAREKIKIISDKRGLI